MIVSPDFSLPFGTMRTTVFGAQLPVVIRFETTEADSFENLVHDWLLLHYQQPIQIAYNRAIPDPDDARRYGRHDRPDFVLYLANGSVLLVCDAKSGKSLSKGDVDQAAHYRSIMNARRAIIFTSPGCTISKPVLLYAAQCQVELGELEWHGVPVVRRWLVAPDG